MLLVQIQKFRTGARYDLEFYTRVSNGLNLKVRKFLGLTLTFVEVKGEKLVGRPFCIFILNRVNGSVSFFYFILSSSKVFMFTTAFQIILVSVFVSRDKLVWIKSCFLLCLSVMHAAGLAERSICTLTLNVLATFLGSMLFYLSKLVGAFM